MQSRLRNESNMTRLPALEAQVAMLGVDRRLAGLFRRKGAIQRLAHHQPISLQGRDSFLLVLSGVVAIAAAPTAGEEQIVALVFPGDVLATRLAGPLPNSKAYALGQTELVRTFASDLASEPAQGVMGVDDLLLQQTERLWSSAATQALIISRLPAQERVISLIVRLALRLGRFAGNRVALTLPMSRTDMANYLALNSETLSRTITRIRKLGLVKLTGRREVTITDWAALCAATPLAGTLTMTDRTFRSNAPSL